MTQGREIHIELEKDPNYPTPEMPRHRFVKELTASPWSDTIEATIDLEDPAWELLGHPNRLRVTIAESP